MKPKTRTRFENETLIQPRQTLETNANRGASSTSCSTVWVEDLSDADQPTRWTRDLPSPFRDSPRATARRLTRSTFSYLSTFLPPLRMALGLRPCVHGPHSAIECLGAPRGPRCVRHSRPWRSRWIRFLRSAQRNEGCRNVRAATPNGP